MKIDNYKYIDIRHSASYNIKYCPKCKKYQHFRRCYNTKGYRDKCSVCDYMSDNHDL